MTSPGIKADLLPIPSIPKYWGYGIGFPIVSHTHRIHVWYMYGICMVNGWYMYGIWMVYVWYMDGKWGICMGYDEI